VRKFDVAQANVRELELAWPNRNQGWKGVGYRKEIQEERGWRERLRILRKLACKKAVSGIEKT
jgi:hypothetical protein